MKYSISLFSFTLLVSTLSARAGSDLWGRNGETWDPEGRLQDFSNVGYKSGDVPIPLWPVGVNVRDFGAVPGDGKDDSQAILDAIAACPDEHAVLIPKGRYDILQQIRIERDNVVLRGEDMYETVLFFPKYLGEIYPAVDYDKSYRSAFFKVMGGTQRSIENLSMEFREQIKRGHWEFRGADAISYSHGVQDSWIRNIYIKNADSGLQFGGADRVSAINIILDHFSGRPSVEGSSGVSGWVGHVGIGLAVARRCLIHNIRFVGRYYHDFDIINVPSHTVLSNIRGSHMALHNHGMNANHNLYTNVYSDIGNRLVGVGNSQKRETLWNIDAGDQVNPVNMESTNNHVFVGVMSGQPTLIREDLWFEAFEKGQLEPKNIYLAQLAFRGKPLPQGPPPPVPVRIGNLVLLNPVQNTSPDRRNPDQASGTGSIKMDEAYFKFDLTGLDLKSVATARLRIAAGRTRPPLRFSLSTVSDDSWSEATLTYNNRPAEGAEVGSAEITDTRTPHWMEFDVTAFVQAEWEGDRMVSLKLLKTTSGYQGTLSGRNGGNAPVLLIEQVESDEPGPPSPPVGLRAAGKPGHILLDWDDNPEADVVTYKVYRNPTHSGKQGFSHPVATGLTLSEFEDVTYKENRANCDLPSDVTFTYTVTAVDSHGYESAPSAEVSGVALAVPDQQ